MTRTQAVLLLALATVAALALSQAVWGLVVPVVVGIVTGVPDLVRSVPSWMWWVALGLFLSMRGEGCGRRACRSRRAASSV